MARPIPTFSCETFHLDGSLLIVLAGELDVSTLECLRDGVHGLAHRYDPDQITFDVTDLTFIDLYGVRQLLRLVNRFGPGDRPTLRNPCPQVRLALALGDADEQFRWDRQDAE